MSEIQYGGRQTGSTYISGSTLDSSKIPKATPMFPWIIGATACTSMSYVFPLYVEFNMAAGEPEVVITNVVLWLEMPFQKLLPCFQGSTTRWYGGRCLFLKAVRSDSIWRPPNRK